MSLPRITLTTNEHKLADLLVACADWVDENPSEVDQLRLKDDNGEWIGKLRGDDKVELRIAGGWVRDKVSRLSDHDSRKSCDKILES
jgi:tRNA nucleotidyltransferase (CCA-adding enzyme)